MKARVNLMPGIAILAVLAVAATPGALAQEDEAYGEALSGSETVKISELLSNPGPYVGKVVRVQGVVSDVCKKSGSWMTIAAEGKDSQQIRIEAADDETVFPREAKGRKATVEGTFTKIELTLEQTIQRLETDAEALGEEFDPASVTEPLVIYKIEGTGAVLR